MKTVVVGLADCQVSAEDAVLVTYALGSCIAVAAYDPLTHVGGLLHYLLPAAELDRAKARRNPFLFADTGIPKLLIELARRGFERRRSIVYVAGGAQLPGCGLFEIGRHNTGAARELLLREGVSIAGEAVGGTVARTVRLDLSTGHFEIEEKPL